VSKSKLKVNEQPSPLEILKKKNSLIGEARRDPTYSPTRSYDQATNE